MNVHPSINIDKYPDYLQLAIDNGYHFIFYNETDNYEKFIILRHDIDLDLACAVRMSTIEYELGISATYFIMLHNELYNIFSKNNLKRIEKLISNGHTIGLHFDPSFYSRLVNMDQIISFIHKEIQHLSGIIDYPVYYVSFHQPITTILETDYRDNVFESVYNHHYFRAIRYISDSRGQWFAESFDELIRQNTQPKIQFLCHPVLWFNANEIQLSKRLMTWVKDRQNRLTHDVAHTINDPSRNMILLQES